MKDVRWLIVAVCLGVSIVLAGCGAASSAETAAAGGGDVAAPAATSTTLSFAADMKPILDKHCADCHLGGGSKGGFSHPETHVNRLLFAGSGKKSDGVGM